MHQSKKVTGVYDAELTGEFSNVSTFAQKATQ